MSSEIGFALRGDSLACDQVALPEITSSHGTPTYVYSKRVIVDRYRAYDDALAGLPHQICFAVKANSNLAVLQSLAKEGAGFDIVSGGELFRVLAAGGNPTTVVFSGVGKTDDEIVYALESSIQSFNCESEEEVQRISRFCAARGKTASVAMRVNPDVDAVTHPYISTGLREHKFGIDITEAPSVYQRIAQLTNVRVEGVSCHIGSQLLDMEPVLEAADKVLQLIKTLNGLGIPIQNLDLGGGLGIAYRPTETSINITEFAAQLRLKLHSSGLRVMLEPGRSIVAEAGVLLTRVLLIKKNGAKTFVIVDAGMNDLLRPALYQAHHEIIPVSGARSGKRMIADVVGPVCETGDFFARDREMPEVKAGDLIAICSAGAYGFVLASNYNSRPRACEVLVEGNQVHVARARESYEDLVRGERLIRDSA